MEKENEMDDDFQLAIKLSMELNGPDSSSMLPNLPSTSKTDSSSNSFENRKLPIESNDFSQPSTKLAITNEDEDYQLALRLSEELNNQPSTSYANRNHSFAPNLAMESSYCDEIKFDSENKTNLPSCSKTDSSLNSYENRKRPSETNDCNQPSKKLAAMNEDEDYQLALKLSEELNNQPSTSYASADYLLAVKLSQDLNPVNPGAVVETVFLPAETSDFEVSNENHIKNPNNTPEQDYEWYKDDDYLLALELSQEDMDPSNIDDEPTPSTSSDDSKFSKMSIDENGNNPGKGAIPYDEFSWDDEDDEDYLLSVKLSREDNDPNNLRVLKPVNGDNVQFYRNQASISVIDPTWETIDPNPDIYSLFVAFNERFFWGKLDSVEVKWSPRMTSCAGVCSYSPRAGLCSVRLSKPLLQFRPRKDLVETLLHEMIHAFLFVTRNDRDRDGHGPRFHSHMYRINAAGGANITVYHNFHDEVKFHKNHWWRCDGPCQHKPPYHGYVKRSMNRVPGPNDLWWNDHRATCGGNFIKVKEPPNYKNKNPKKSDDRSKVNNINNYFHTKTSTSSTTASGSTSVKPFVAGISKPNSVGTSVTPNYFPTKTSTTTTGASNSTFVIPKPSVAGISKPNSVGNSITPTSANLYDQGEQSVVSVSPKTSFTGINKSNIFGTSISRSSVMSVRNPSGRGQQILNMVKSHSGTGGIISNQKTKSPSENHWSPLPGQKNIFQFINRS